LTSTKLPWISRRRGVIAAITVGARDFTLLMHTSAADRLPALTETRTRKVSLLAVLPTVSASLSKKSPVETPSETVSTDCTMAGSCATWLTLIAKVFVSKETTASELRSVTVKEASPKKKVGAVKKISANSVFKKAGVPFNVIDDAIDVLVNPIVPTETERLRV